MTDPRKVEIAARLAQLGVLAAFSALMTARVVLPALALHREEAKLREALGVLKQANGDLKLLDEKLRRMRAQLKASEEMLPKEIDLDQFLDEVGEIAERKRVSVERLAPVSIGSHTLFRELVLDIQMEGRFLRLCEVMALLEGGKRLARINSLTLTPSREGRSCSATFRLALYFAPRQGVSA